MNLEQLIVSVEIGKKIESDSVRGIWAAHMALLAEFQGDEVIMKRIHDNMFEMIGGFLEPIGVLPWIGVEEP